MLRAAQAPAGFLSIEDIMNRTNWLSSSTCILAFTLALLAGCMREPSTVVDARRSELPDVQALPAVLLGKAPAGTDNPLFGGTPARNMVNTIDKDVPTVWKVEEGKRQNIKWVADLGSNAYGGPTIAGGIIYVGTNNSNPRDDKIKTKAIAVLMAFKEADGKFLWQLTHESPPDALFNEGRSVGLCSTPVAEGQRVFYVTPGCEVVCADTAGKIQWSYDMMKELKVIPFHLSNCSPLIVGDLVMVVTGNGVDDEGKVASPKAPSFIAINKKTGKLVWQSSLPGERIVEGQFSNPTLATINGKPQVIFPGGDCVLYSFEPKTGKLIWKCNCNPIPRKKGNEPYFISTPVAVGDRLYVGLGVAPDGASHLSYSHFLCLDMTKQGDVSLKSHDAKAAANKNSALVWSFGGMINPPPAKGRKASFGSTMSTAAVHDELIYIPEETGYLHCLDAKTGERYWDHDFKASVWGSPYYVDGKVFVGTDDGEVVIFAPGKTRKVLATNEMDGAVQSTPVVANGVLYIIARSKLYAIANGK